MVAVIPITAGFHLNTYSNVGKFEVQVIACNFRGKETNVQYHYSTFDKNG